MPQTNEGGRGVCPIFSNIEPKQIKIHSESKYIKWRPPHLGIKKDWQDKIKNIRIGRKEAEDLDKTGDANLAIPFYDENLYMLNVKNDLETKASESIPSVERLAAATRDLVPPSSVLKQFLFLLSGTSLKDDIMRLYQLVHLLVGTPGRILDLSKKGVCILKDCSVFVMDEVYVTGCPSSCICPGMRGRAMQIGVLLDPILSTFLLF